MGKINGLHIEVLKSAAQRIHREAELNKPRSRFNWAIGFLSAACIFCLFAMTAKLHELERRIDNLNSKNYELKSDIMTIRSIERRLLLDGELND